MKSKRGARVGRPKLMKSPARLVVQVETTEKTRLEKAAAKRGISLGQFLREALGEVGRQP